MVLVIAVWAMFLPAQLQREELRGALKSNRWTVPPGETGDNTNSPTFREGIESIINPDDLHAVEAAVTLKDRVQGKVTALSMGPPQAIDSISEAMGMGVDQGILLSDMAFAGADTWATSFTLGKAIKDRSIRSHPVR